ncbi:MAG: M15 family metallopeptidase [Clostridia bacterium]
MKFKNKIFSFFSFLSAIFITTGSCASKKQTENGGNTPMVLFHTPASVTQTPHPPTEPPSPTAAPTPEAHDFVRIIDYVPEAFIDLKYATTENFTGQIIYDFTEAYARYGTVAKLAQAQKLLSEKGYRIKIWDAYRPVAAQRKLWEICPDGNFVSNPNIGYSNHTRGCALDLTLVDPAGNEIEMPTPFDNFTPEADRDYSDVGKTAAENARMLEDIMQSCGFQGYYNEWWHFNDTVKYEPELEFQPPE